jgi:hypothetical protein
VDAERVVRVRVLADFFVAELRAIARDDVRLFVCRAMVIVSALVDVTCNHCTFLAHA